MEDIITKEGEFNLQESPKEEDIKEEKPIEEEQKEEEIIPQNDNIEI